MAEITGVVITLNEEKNIADCLRSLKQVCTHLVIVDSKSTDRTCEIAAAEGAKVVVQAYLGDGPQKNFVAQQAQTNWVLSIDADERLTSHAVQIINNLNLDSTSYDSFAFRRRNYIGSRWIRYGGWYPDYCVRLYRKDQCQFSNIDGHAEVQGKNTKFLRADIIHYSYRDFVELFAKVNLYSTQGAKTLYRRGKRPGPLAPATHGIAAFIRRYIIRGGFLGGLDGLTVALSAGMNSYLKYAKVREVMKDEKVLKEFDLDSIW